MTTARDIMNAGVTCVGEHETLSAAAQHMREHDIGALPICGDDDRLHGMLTDRDIVIKGLAAGIDPGHHHGWGAGSGQRLPRGR